jgi:hypothetical protein
MFIGVYMKAKRAYKDLYLTHFNLFFLDFQVTKPTPMAPTRARKQKSKQFSSPQLYGLDVDHK